MKHIFDHNSKVWGSSGHSDAGVVDETSDDVLFSAVSGDSWTTDLATLEAYYNVAWYVKGPGDTSQLGVNIESDSGSSTSTTADMAYTFSSGIAGDYVITAVISNWSDMSVSDEISYTVSVSAKTPTETTTTPSNTLTSSDGSYSATEGDSHEANFTTTQAYSSVYWYVKSPSDTSYYGTNVEIDYGDSSTTTTAQLSYSFPSGVFGDYVITAYVYDGDGTTVYETSYTVSVTSSSNGSTENTSPEDTSTTPSTPTTTSPGAPTNFSVAHGYAQGIIGLYWSVPDSDGGAAINDYEYQYRYATGFNGVSYTWSAWSSWSSAGTSGFYLVYGLTSRVIYEVKMRAVNSNGGGTETDACSISVN